MGYPRSLAILLPLVLLSASPAIAQSGLDELSGNWPDAELRLTLRGHEGGQVEIGQSLEFGVSSKAGGYLMLAHVNADNEVSFLFPGAPTQGSQPNIAANSELLFPGANSNLQLEAQLPIGDETLFAILTEKPITSASFGDPDGQIYIGESGSASLSAQLRSQLDMQKSSGHVAISKLAYEIVPLSGDVQFTTRAIERYFGEPPAKPDAGGKEPRKIPLRIQFAFDSAELTDSARRELDVFGQALSGPMLSGRPFTIAGHTDNAGTEEYNMDLSRRRANAAIAYLVKEHGIDPATLTAAAFGESQPRRDNATEEGRRQNRRVEFIER